MMMADAVPIAASVVTVPLHLLPLQFACQSCHDPGSKQDVRTGSLIQVKILLLRILFSKAARRQRPVRRQRPGQTQSRVEGRAETGNHGWRPMRSRSRPIDPSVSRCCCIVRTLFRAARCRMPMTAGTFPLRIRPLSSWNGTSRVQCRPFFHPENPRQWPHRGPAGPLHRPDGRDVVAHGALPTTAGTGALGLHPDQAVQVEPSLLTGVFAQIDATVDGGYEGMAEPVHWRSAHQSGPGVWPCFTLPRGGACTCG